jgi:hypothetical protein
MQIKLKVVRLTQNEDGTITTKFQPELVGAIGGEVVSGNLFITVPNQDVQPEILVYNVEVNSDLEVFVEKVEVVEEPIV